MAYILVWKLLVVSVICLRDCFFSLNLTCLPFFLSAVCSVVQLGNVFLHATVQKSEVSPVYFLFLFAFKVDQEARFARQRSMFQTGHHFFRHKLLTRTEELHAGEVSVVFHKEGPIVLFDGVAATAPVKMDVDNEELLVLDTNFFLELFNALDLKKHLFSLASHFSWLLSLLVRF